MPFPEIHSCVISDDLRPELSGKASIIGFYGIAPNVDIILKDLFQPLAMLTISLLAGRGLGTFKLSMNIADEDGRQLFNVSDYEVNITDQRKKNSWTFQFSNFKFNRAGRHALTVRYDNNVVFSTTFEVRQGTPEDFPQ